MEENKKPLFPRDPEDDPQNRRELRENVKQKLEAAESGARIELPPLERNKMPPPPAPAYGPPPLLRLLKISPILVAIAGLIVIAALLIFLFSYLR